MHALRYRDQPIEEALFRSEDFVDGSADTVQITSNLRSTCGNVTTHLEAPLILKTVLRPAFSTNGHMQAVFTVLSPKNWTGAVTSTTPQTVTASEPQYTKIDEETTQASVTLAYPFAQFLHQTTIRGTFVATNMDGHSSKTVEGKHVLTGSTVSLESPLCGSPVAKVLRDIGGSTLSETNPTTRWELQVRQTHNRPFTLQFDVEQSCSYLLTAAPVSDSQAAFFTVTQSGIDTMKRTQQLHQRCQVSARAIDDCNQDIEITRSIVVNAHTQLSAPHLMMQRQSASLVPPGALVEMSVVAEATMAGESISATADIDGSQQAQVQTTPLPDGNTKLSVTLQMPDRETANVNLRAFHAGAPAYVEETTWSFRRYQPNSIIDRIKRWWR